MVLVQRVLVLALLEELVAHLAHFPCDLERNLRVLADVLAVDWVLVLGVVLVHVPVGRDRLRERRVIRSELAAVCDHTRLNWDVTGGGLGVLDRAHDGLAADDLAKDDVLPVEVRRRVAGDEELGAVRVRSRVRLRRSGFVWVSGARPGGEGGRTMERRKRFECLTSKFSSSNFSP